MGSLLTVDKVQQLINHQDDPAISKQLDSDRNRDKIFVQSDQKDVKLPQYTIMTMKLFWGAFFLRNIKAERNYSKNLKNTPQKLQL